MLPALYRVQQHLHGLASLLIVLVKQTNGEYTSMTIDSNDVLHIAYSCNRIRNPPNMPLFKLLRVGHPLHGPLRT